MSAATIWRPRNGWALGLAAAALLQSATLGWMLWDRISILRSETEIVLTPEPIDPRDLFRGDYVILRYGISRPPLVAPAPDGAPDAREGAPATRAVPEGDAPPARVPRTPTPEEIGPVWAAIAPDAEGRWRVVEISKTRPTPPEGGHALRAEWSWRGLAYGLERYYVPEGAGRDLERRIGDRAVEVTVAVAEDGRAAIKGLRVEGEVVFEEPWF